jgi:Alanine dehydrogenase/PNT, N-terminal domain
MKIGAPREVFPCEARVAMTPESALQLQKMGHVCFVEAGAGEKCQPFPLEGFDFLSDLYLRRALCPAFFGGRLRLLNAL